MLYSFSEQYVLKNIYFSETLNNYNAPQHFVQHSITDHLSVILK